MKTNVTILLLATAFLVNAQTVRTITNGGFYDDLFLHPNGILYGSEFFNNTIWEFDTQTEQVSIFKSNLINPNGIGANPQGKLYICDHGHNKLIKFETDGTFIDEYTGIITPSGVKNIPGTNDMLFVEYATNKVGILYANDTSKILYANGQLAGPAGITFINGVTYISNYNDRKIIKLENGIQTLITQLPLESIQNLGWLGFIDSKYGFIYATSGGGNKIYKINPVTGDFSVFAGSTQGSNDGALQQATFDRPNGILFDDASDRLYISEVGSNNLRIIENVSLALTTNENQLSSSDIKLYPNPANKEFTVSSENIHVSEGDFLKIFSNNGYLVYQKAFTETAELNEMIKIDCFSSGSYIIYLRIDDVTLNKKFMKN